MAKTILMILILILGLLILVEQSLHPRLDVIHDTHNNEKWLVLWVGKYPNRHHIKLFKQKI